ncbi:MAG: 1-deoxy-D-xylulose-5-phosphate synthase [Dehalococcoidia bacterium]|nr:1-deoxy-D-xylulose-5-phosphate synthase [Dehalococcoidia bacterium]HCU99776.1 1-deoxy-D-xylulose-5-phosphate synthase [Dehalococcoidia bacterium]
MALLLDKINSPADLRSLSSEELEQLAGEIREELVNTIQGIGGGGHLASNLGVVELTLSLHRQFDSPTDRMLWDVSHQVYVHKMVTGRRDQMATIRQYEGLSGFADRNESPHDLFGAGHAGTSISAATGMAAARDLRGEDHHVIAIIGDGAMTAGMAFEGLNHAGHLGTNLIVILNDNSMSISPNVGALSRNVNKLRIEPHYRRAKQEIGEIVEQFPIGRNLAEQMWNTAQRVKSSMRDLIVPASFWEQFGFDYYGPIDGHNLNELEETLSQVKKVRGKPVLLHVLTEKGHGIPEAAADPVKSHSGTFWLKEAPAPDAPKAPPTYSQVFAQAVGELIEKDSRVVAITAAMLEGTGLASTQKEHPDRVFDVGIAEQHGVTFAAGLATQGMRPIAAIYSTFLQRGFDSIVHDIVVQKLPVIFALDRAGFVGDDGKTHQGFIDTSYMRCLPNMVVTAPKDEAELRDLLFTAVTQDSPFSVRYPRGAGPGAPTDQPMKNIPIGKSELLRDGMDVTLIGFGASVIECVKASELLLLEGVEARVINARFAKPLDQDMILAAARETGGIITAEENVRAGGFGEAVLALLADHKAPEALLLNLTMPDDIVDHGPQKVYRGVYDLDGEGIARQAMKVLLDRRPERKGSLAPA